MPVAGAGSADVLEAQELINEVIHLRVVDRAVPSGQNRMTVGISRLRLSAWELLLHRGT